MDLLASQISEFIFREVVKREGTRWLGPRRSSNMSKYSTSNLFMLLERWEVPLEPKTRARLEGLSDLGGLLQAHLLKGVRLDSHMGLWGLVSGAYPLVILRDIPSPQQMLDRQCAGERYVTFLTEDIAVGRFKNRFEFLMHDLEHAHKFFGYPELCRAQVNFFNYLRAVLPEFAPWAGDPLFAKDLHYLMSDMNSHPVHLFKYMKAIVLAADLRRGGDGELDEFWARIFPLAAGLRINRPGLETPADQTAVYDFFAIC